MAPFAVAISAAPSFDCARAAAFAERLACRDPRLAEQDRTMADRYRQALATAPDPDALRSEQRAALRRRDACRARACVANWYRVRLVRFAAASARPRLAIGACADTRVGEIGPRLSGGAGGGVYVAYADGLSQVSYDSPPGVSGWRVGDPVRICLQSLPVGCPPGDMRGAVYAAANGRTGGRWVAGDSEHRCGGA